MRRSVTGAPRIGSPTRNEPTTVARRGLRALVEQSIGHLANAWSLRRWRGLLYRIRDVYRAAAALICLGRWLHRVST
jgi:hypothetical protein